jgi:hypothetical protein
MSRPRRESRVKREVVVKEEEVQEERDDADGESEEAAVAGDDLIRVYKAGRENWPSSRPVSGERCK